MAEFSDDPDAFSEISFGFFQEQEDSHDSSCNSTDFDVFDEEGEITPFDVEEKKKFWETQNQLLQGTTYRTSALESRIRQSTKHALREIKEQGISCFCRNPFAGECRDCLKRQILVRLQNEGFNCVFCKSKWKRTHDIPSGEHSYLEVVERVGSKKSEVRVVIELGFRAEFEMARASEEYNELIKKLPEVFVGKSERLMGLIKILCSAAKTCMKEKKMHLGPWRKHKFMQSKWLGTCETTASTPLPAVFSDRRPKPKASMLTFDMLETMLVDNFSTRTGGDSEIFAVKVGSSSPLLHLYDAGGGLRRKHSDA